LLDNNIQIVRYVSQA